MRRGRRSARHLVVRVVIATASVIAYVAVVAAPATSEKFPTLVTVVAASVLVGLVVGHGEALLAPLLAVGVYFHHDYISTNIAADSESAPIVGLWQYVHQFGGVAVVCVAVGLFLRLCATEAVERLSDRLERRRAT